MAKIVKLVRYVPSGARKGTASYELTLDCGHVVHRTASKLGKTAQCEWCKREKPQFKEKAVESTKTLKVNGIEITAKEFAFDGCHKIYLINSDEERTKFIDMGYDPLLPIKELEDAYETSCGLRFIQNGDFTDVVDQFEDDVKFEGFNHD
jgi:hypothetical protein